MHTPVLLQEVIEALAVAPGQKYIDATFGEGRHSAEIIKRGGSVLGIEWNNESLKSIKSKVVLGNFSKIEKIARENDFCPAAGVLFDLGISMMQIEQSGRGFSYNKPDEPLDMRINTEELKQTAVDLINSLSKEELYEIFAGNSEELNSGAIADAIYRSRRVRKISTVGDLLQIINNLNVQGNKEGIIRRIFQALRMEVNHELENLKKGLEGAAQIIKPGGRIVVITFHQGEDRMVKRFVRDQAEKITMTKPIITKQPLSFERSAKLRVMTL